MYNRYIPQEEYTIAVEPETAVHTATNKDPFASIKDMFTGSIPDGLRGFLTGKQDGEDPLGGLLKSLNITGVDSGDILLILLILFLLIEGDDHWELVITLGLLLIMGLADREEAESQ